MALCFAKWMVGSSAIVHFLKVESVSSRDTHMICCHATPTNGWQLVVLDVHSDNFSLRRLRGSRLQQLATGHPKSKVAALNIRNLPLTVAERGELAISTLTTKVSKVCHGGTHYFTNYTFWTIFKMQSCLRGCSVPKSIARRVKV